MTTQYAGDDTQWIESVGMPDDGEDNSATVLNTPVQGNRNAIAFLYRTLFKGVLHNWPYRAAADPPEGGATACSEITCKPVWDPVALRWIFAGLDSATAHNKIFQVNDLGNSERDEEGESTLEEFGSWDSEPTHAFSAIHGLVVIPTGANAGRVLACVDSQILYCDPNGDWTDSGFVFTSIGGTSDQDPASDMLWLASASKVVGVFNGGLVSPSVKLATSANGTAWTDLSAQIPAQVNADVSWCAAVSPTLWVGFSKTANRTKYITSGDGVTFTERTLTITAGDATTDITWTGSHWIRSVVNGTATKIYRSSDAINWTLVATISSCTIRSLASLERRLLVGLSDYEPDPNNAGYRRAMVSADRGATWTPSRFRLRPNGFQAVTSGGGQFVAVAGRTMFGSLVVGS